MQMIKETDLKVLYSESEIQSAIAKLGEKLNEVYKNEELYLICVLKGSVMFMTDLSKHLKMPVRMEFIRLSSYGSGFTSSGRVSAVDISLPDLNDKNVLIIEDIIDTGRTLNDVCRMLRARNPLSLRVVTLLDKPSRRVVDFKADYSLFTIPDYFVIGYGLDCGEYYRNLPYIAEYKEV